MKKLCLTNSKIFVNIIIMKNSKMNRRAFIRNTAASTAALGIGASTLPALANAEKKGAKAKVGLYSITFLGVWYKGRALSMEEVLKKSVELGFDGIEIDGKRPHGNPLDWPTNKCKDFAAKANDMGQEIYAVSGNNDFSSPIPEHRECQIAYMKELIRMTADFGVQNLRVFLGWPGVTLHPDGGKYTIAHDIWQHTHYQFSPEEIWNWCREGMIECAGYARDYGVTLALQNHKPVINNWRDMMRMVKEVDSPHLKVCLDAPIMEDKSPENMMEAAKAAGDLQVLTHFGGEYGKDENGKVIDIQTYKREIGSDGKPIPEEIYPDFVKAMNSINYSGFYSYELCHPLPVKNGEKVGIDFAESCAGNACEMMKGLLNVI
jgi:sugar phosphate isomerase/epimerase